ncbi:MAG TPA: GyrI-like domain-containing protein [Pirellulales bacterium]|nr:GyrI-like domain-containing protein [Pirellulales bacterium]
MSPPRIVDKPGFTAVGFEAAFIHALSPDATNFKVIGPLWDKFFQRINQVADRIGDEMYGVIYGKPEAERTHPHELQYLAGVPVSEAAEIPEGMVSRAVAAGTFAVFIHRGPIRNIGKTVHDIYRVWLPQSPYRHAEIADVELYDRRFCVDSDDSEMEYWISVTPCS